MQVNKVVSTRKLLIIILIVKKSCQKQEIIDAITHSYNGMT